MKKIVTLMFALTLAALCAAVLPTEVEAASEGDLTFTLNSDGAGYTVSDCSSSARGQMIIPATHNGLPVTSIGDSAFYDCYNLTSITIPDSVTSIGNYAFYDCTSLTTATIGKGVTSIGYSAFDDDDMFAGSALENVYLSDLAAWCKVKIANYSGSPLNCTENVYINGEKVNHLVIPDGVTSIGANAFAGCYSWLTSVTIPNSVTSIGDYAFYDARLKSITIPNGVTSIGRCAFGDNSFASLTIPDSVTSIGEKAFWRCEQLTTVTLPNSITSIGEEAFYWCRSLTSITIPDRVTRIGPKAFYHCLGLSSITLPKSLQSIADSSFGDCENLESVFYKGSQEEWDKVVVGRGNVALNNATVIVNFTCAHTWNSGTVTKAATCKETGVKTYTCTGCSATRTEDIAKTNNHSYGGWTDLGNGNHKHTCSVCQKEETKAHTWNGGTVTKAASCKENGVKTYTCTTCNATKTETIAKTTDHKYGSWTKVNDITHKHTCSVCSKEETANHTWNSGAVTKQPTCKEEGVKTYTCSDCKGTKTEPVAKTTDHKYGSWTKVNDTTHKHTCSVCSKEETANHTWNSGAVTKKATCKEEGVKTYTCTACNATKTESIAKLTTHTYDHACDTDCNVCGVTRTTTHNYKTSWSKDKTNHWHECSVCKGKKDVVAHTPGAAATETTAQTCTACGYIIQPALGHKHNYATTWTTDDAGHWYACSGCEEKGSYAEHDFENACDKDCSICGYTRDTDHSYSTEWKSDKENHWHECAGCGEKGDAAAHEPGAEATETTAQTCTICGYEIAPALGLKDTEPTTTPVTPTEPADKDEPSADPTVWIVVAVVILVGIVAGVIIWKKKR